MGKYPPSSSVYSKYQFLKHHLRCYKKSIDLVLKFELSVTLDLMLKKCLDKKTEYAVVFLESRVLEFLPNRSYNSIVF